MKTEKIDAFAIGAATGIVMVIAGMIAISMLAGCGGVLGAVVLDAGDVDAGSLAMQDSGPPPDAGPCSEAQWKAWETYNGFPDGGNLEDCSRLQGMRQSEYQGCLAEGMTQDQCLKEVQTWVPMPDCCF